MYPPILILHPNLAKSLIQYRFNLIPGAERKAKSYHLGYQGTMFRNFLFFFKHKNQ